jgi:methylmalonyl-CoA decarboxylase
VLSCGILIGDKTCSFPISPVNLGLPYGTTGFIRSMNRIPLNFVRDMFFTAPPVNAGDAGKKEKFLIVW